MDVFWYKKACELSRYATVRRFLRAVCRCCVVCSTIILVVVFSQFLRGLQVNFCVRIDGRWEERGFPFFGVFAVRTLRYTRPAPQRCVL